MNKQQLDALHETIKDKYGDCTSVNIFVNCEGLTINTTKITKTDKGISMRTINGEWIRGAH